MEHKPYHPELLMQPEDVAFVAIHALILPRSVEVTEISMRPLAKSYGKQIGYQRFLSSGRDSMRHVSLFGRQRLALGGRRGRIDHPLHLRIPALDSRFNFPSTLARLLPRGTRSAPP